MNKWPVGGKELLRTFAMVAVLTIAGSLSTVAANWSFMYRPAATKYVIYGAGLGDPVAPSKKDAKVAFEITGGAAKDIFEAIGPDKPDQCAPTAGVRFRSKDDDKLACLRSPTGQYSCSFGFNLNSGKSTISSIC